MADVEKSLKQLVIEANLRLVGLLAPHQDVREFTAGSATNTEVPEQQQDVSQPPTRRATWVTINELTSTPRPAAAPTPPRKGKKKAFKPILESSDKNAFDVYAKSANKKKSHKHQSREGYSNPSTKKSRTEDPPVPTPTKETTPPPAPARDATPPFPVNPDPPSPVGQTPPPAPADLTPLASTVQQPAGCREEASGDDLTGVGVLTMTSGWQSSRTLTAQFKKKLSDQLSAAKAQYAEQLKANEATHAEQMKEVKVKHTEALKEAEAKHIKALQVTEAKLASLEEELKKKEASIAKITASKEQYKETSLIKYREAQKLQVELEISRK
ncbi:uncharacterized protein LOC133779463 [Humulus lupulus]|uniref:uncharacterized protein LOC133779463 n=1 Tax=Humulus lupulus TaxID=3486 RepID=UPI002B406882|nr:uncharacterized protein LOC133779463 [Humulus lupulus]